MPRKVKLILNPMADMGNAWKVANDLRPIVAEYGSADWSGTVYPTHAVELARQAAREGYDMVVAVGMISIRSLISEAAPNNLLILQLEALRSTRAFIAILLVTTLNAVQNSLAGLLFLLLAHTVARRTWAAILIMAVLFLPFISGGTAFQSWTLAAYFLTAGFVHVIILMRVSFLAAIISLYCQFMLQLVPLTLDTRAWYFGYSIVALLVIVALAVYGALVSSASQRPAPHPVRRDMSAPTTV